MSQTNNVVPGIPSSLEGANLGITATYMNTAYAAWLNRDMLRTQVQTYGKSQLSPWLELNGGSYLRDDETFFHAEEDRLQYPIQSAGVTTAGAAGATKTITLATGSLVNGTLNPVMPEYPVLFKNGVWGQVLAVNGADIDVRPLRAFEAIPALAANEKFIFLQMRLVGDGSCPGASSVKYPPVEFVGTMQEVRIDEEYTGNSLATLKRSQLQFNWTNPLTGKEEEKWYVANNDKTYVRFYNANEVWRAFGVNVTNTGLTNLPYKGAVGYINLVKNAGTNLPYSTSTGWGMADMQALAITAEKNNAGREFIGHCGMNFNFGFQNNIKEFFANGQVTYAAFNNSSEEAIQWGYNSVTAYNITFHMQNMSILNQEEWMGNSDFGMMNTCLMMPTKDAATVEIQGKTQTVKHFNVVRQRGAPTEMGLRHYFVDGTQMFDRGNGGAISTNCNRVQFSWEDKSGIEAFLLKHCIWSYGV